MTGTETVAGVTQVGTPLAILSISPSAPVVRAILLPTRVIPVPKVRTDSLELKVFQSVAESAPVVVEFARSIPNTPVVLLYVSGPRAESAVSQILFATVPERERRSVLVVARSPESVAISHTAVARFELVVAREPERVQIFAVFVVICPESVMRAPERAACARVSVK